MFTLPTEKMCKTLWKSAIECHAFYRLTDTRGAAPESGGFFRTGSRFHATARTEYKLTNENPFGSSSFRNRKETAGASTRSAPNTPRPGQAGTAMTSSFKRVRSNRFPERQNFSKRETASARPARLDWTPTSTPAAAASSGASTPSMRAQGANMPPVAPPAGAHMNSQRRAAPKPPSGHGHAENAALLVLPTVHQFFGLLMQRLFILPPMRCYAAQHSLVIHLREPHMKGEKGLTTFR